MHCSLILNARTEIHRFISLHSTHPTTSNASAYCGIKARYSSQLISSAGPDATGLFMEGLNSAVLFSLHSKALSGRRKIKRRRKLAKRTMPCASSSLHVQQTIKSLREMQSPHENLPSPHLESMPSYSILVRFLAPFHQTRLLGGSLVLA